MAKSKPRKAGELHPDAAFFIKEASDLTFDESMGLSNSLAAMRRIGRGLPLSMFGHYFPRTTPQERLQHLHGIAVRRAGVPSYETPVMTAPRPRR